MACHAHACGRITFVTRIVLHHQMHMRAISAFGEAAAIVAAARRASWRHQGGHCGVLASQLLLQWPPPGGASSLAASLRRQRLRVSLPAPQRHACVCVPSAMRYPRVLRRQHQLPSRGRVRTACPRAPHTRPRTAPAAEHTRSVQHCRREPAAAALRNTPARVIVAMLSAAIEAKCGHSVRACAP